MSLPERQLTPAPAQLSANAVSHTLGKKKWNGGGKLSHAPSKHQAQGGSQLLCPLKAEAGQGAPSPLDVSEEVAHGGSQ